MFSTPLVVTFFIGIRVDRLKKKKCEIALLNIIIIIRRYSDLGINDFYAFEMGEVLSLELVAEYNIINVS